MPEPTTDIQPTFPQPRVKKRFKRARSPYYQAVELQHLLMEASNSTKTTPSALAQLARAWSELEERKRILKMKPKPKDVDVSGASRRGPNKADIVVMQEPQESAQA